MIPVRSYVRILRKYLRPLRARVVLLSLTALVGIGLQLAGPQLIRAFLDGATGALRSTNCCRWRFGSL